MIQDGVWAGKTAHVIGGGPSIKFLLDKLRNLPRSIGVNMAFSLNPSLNIVGDERLQQSLASDNVFMAYEGVVFAIDASPINWLNCTRFRKMQGWSRSVQDGLCWHSNTGLAAINLADVLGASSIMLYGFDLASPKKLSANWHDSYPEEWKTNAEQLYERMLKKMLEVLPESKGTIYVVTERKDHPLRTVADCISFETAEKLA